MICRCGRPGIDHRLGDAAPIDNRKIPLLPIVLSGQKTLRSFVAFLAEEITSVQNRSPSSEMAERSHMSYAQIDPCLNPTSDVYKVQYKYL